jgi:hypothetical protein
MVPQFVGMMGDGFAVVVVQAFPPSSVVPSV